MAASAQTEPEDAPGIQSDNYPPTEKRGLESRVAVFGWLFLCLNVFAFGCLAAVDVQLYRVLAREDGWAEYLTAILFFMTGLLLLVTALSERSLVRRSVYILAGIAFLFAAGEEISWGQRILGFGTPDFLMGLNDHGEFNAHNIVTPIANAVVRILALLLCTMSCAAICCRKDALYGIPLPSILLTLGFLTAMAYYVIPSRPPHLLDSIFSLDFNFSQGSNLIILLVIYALLFRQAKQFSGTVVTTMGLLLATAYVHKYNPIQSSRQPEVGEYLLAIVCICYALELLLAQAPARRRIDALVKGIKLPGGRESTTTRNDSPNFVRARLARRGLWEPWLMMCALIILCSIGLALLQYFMGRAEAADFEERYRSIMTGTAGEPVVRAIFDAYLIGNELTYVKEPCDRPNTEVRFFLHLIPANVADLSGERREYGFDNLDFDWAGERHDGRCLATIGLPDYTISSIRTGQFVPDLGNIWTAEWSSRFPILINAGDEADEFEEKYRSITMGTSGGPVVRATFDVYLVGSELTYVKETCEPADTEDVFFLHLTPANLDDLPGERRQYGFDNLDFRWAGAMRDGRCMATIRLPDYAISSISTGQYVPDEGNTWQAEFVVP